MIRDGQRVCKRTNDLKLLTIVRTFFVSQIVNERLAFTERAFEKCIVFTGQTNF